MFSIMNRWGKDKEKSDSKTIHEYQNSFRSSKPVKHRYEHTWFPVAISKSDINGHNAALTLYLAQLF